MFLHVSVILFTAGGGGWYPSMHCRWYPSMPCSMPCSRSPVWGVVSQHALQVSRLTARGEVEQSGQRGLQAHTQGEVEGSGLGGLQAHTQGCIPACTEADPPTATAVGGTHPTGMHSCLRLIFICRKCLYSFHVSGPRIGRGEQATVQRNIIHVTICDRQTNPVSVCLFNCQLCT